MEKFLKAKQLAKRWGIETGTLNQWRWNGKGPYFIKTGGKVLYSLLDIQRFEQVRQCQNTTGKVLEDNHWGKPRKRDFVPGVIIYATDDEGC
jgi:MerR HTH family regulatory protein